VDRPVYDRYTLKQRLAKGLRTMLPALPRYTAEKVAYLTFDDGPDDVNTPAILDVLKAKGVHATFYVLGGMVEKNPAVLKRIFTEGHAIGNHSYDHDYERLYANKESFVEEMEQTDEAVFKVIGMRPFIIRAPGGTVGMFADDYYKHLNLLGYVEHDWNVLTEDATPEQPSAEQQIDYIDRRAAGQLKDNMALVLMHCNGGKEETVRALPGIIDNLKAKGYRFGVVTPITPQPW
jgi:peptidoglycan/xylan/chitin deacetylase (PgdA/CDA1 family)